MGDIIPLVLCGGSGARLWPLSRADRPKQFLRIGGEATLLAETLQRCRGDGFNQAPIIVAAENHAALVSDELRGICMDGDIVLEPTRRDSCAAIIIGTMLAFRRDKNAMVLVVASDHAIPDSATFRATAIEATEAAGQGFIVTFGVTPTGPASGYGYIVPSQQRAGAVAWRVAAFVEKPDAGKASALLAEGCLWNSGNFLFRASEVLSEAKHLAPNVYHAAARGLATAQRGPHGLCLAETDFAQAPRISFDRAIMEKTDRAAVMPVTYAWRDLGTWDAVAASLNADIDGNVLKGPATIAGSRDCMVLSTAISTALVGCDGIIVVSSPQGILVARKGTTESVRELGEEFARRDTSIVKTTDIDCAFETLDSSTGHRVSRVTIPTGKRYVPTCDSASRHWFVVRGRISLNFNGKVEFYQAGHVLQSPNAENAIIGNVDSDDSVLVEIAAFQTTAIRCIDGQHSQNGQMADPPT